MQIFKPLEINLPDVGNYEFSIPTDFGASNLRARVLRHPLHPLNAAQERTLHGQMRVAQLRGNSAECDSAIVAVQREMHELVPMAFFDQPDLIEHVHVCCNLRGGPQR